jgi:integrase
MVSGRFKGRVDLLGAQSTKTGERRTVPLNGVAKAALVNLARFQSAHCPISPWVFCVKRGERIQNVKKGFATACCRAEIKDFHPHDLRHACAAWLVTAGVPPPEIRDLLGHSTIQMTERYVHCPGKCPCRCRCFSWQRVTI